jgi:iron complex outermembrane recepter protein
MTTHIPLVQNRNLALNPVAGAVAALGISMAMGAALPARAQSAGNTETVTEVITVTSQRREQELQKVPLPISTFRAIELEQRAITDTLKVASFVPNMFASNNTGLGTANVYYIRGLGNTESIATFDPPVGTYIDDIYVSRQNANNFSFFDVERIEVLRGPQGTLFGRNTTGGAMRVIMKRPGFKAGGFFNVGMGNYGEVSARASYDIPFSDSLSTKLSFFAKEDRGYVNNLTTGETLNSASTTGLRGALRWRLSDDLNWDLALEGMRDDGLALQNIEVDGKRVSKTGLRSTYRFFNAAGNPLIAGDKANFGLGNKVRSTALTSNIRWSGSEYAAFEFITGWRDMTQKFALDFGNTPVPSGGFTIVNDGRHKQISQELKAVGDVGPVAYVAGLFYMKEDNRTDFADVFNTAFSGAPPPGTTLILADRLLKNDVKTSAIYAQGDYKLGPLTATLGLRYTKEAKSIDFFDNRTTAAAASRLDTANLVAAGVPISQTASVTTPRAALAWQVDPATMLFGSATRGFKSGGWNARGTSPATLQPFLPEFIWSYEGGWRTAFLNNRVRLNGTLFSSTTQQLQTPSAFVAPSGAVSFITRNFADLSNRGFELDVNAQVGAGFSLYAALGLQNAKYTNIADSILVQQKECRDSIAANATARPRCLNGIVDATGEIAPPVRTPKQSLNAGTTYTLGLGAYKVVTSINAAYVSRTSVGTAANAYAEAHTLLNSAVALSDTTDVWRVTLDCSNCTNKNYIASFLAGLNYLNDPRRFSVRLNYKL